MPVGLRRPYFGCLFIDDATGFESASTPTAEVVKSDTKVVAGERNKLALSATDGTITLPSGLPPKHFRVGFDVGSVIGGNASVITFEVYKNGAVIASATGALGGAIKSINKMQATAATHTQNASGIVKLDSADVLTLRCTGTVGTVLIKQLYFYAIEL